MSIKSMRFTVGCLLLVAASPAISSEMSVAEPPVPLWSGLTTATSRAEMRAFRAQLPGKRADLLPGCRAEFGYRFVKDRLASIILLGTDKEAPCGDLLLRDLTRQHGQPEPMGVTFGSSIGTATSITVRSTSEPGYVWRTGGRRILLIRAPGGGYNLIFTVRPEKFLS